jgi:hypothetical protein
MPAVLDPVLQLQTALDGFPAGPDQADRVSGQGAELLVQRFTGWRTGGHKKLFVGHAQRHHVVGMGLAQRQDVKHVVVRFKSQRLHLHQPGNPGQRAVPFVLGDQEALDQFERTRAQQVGVFSKQLVQRIPVQEIELQQRFTEIQDGQAALPLERLDQQRQAVNMSAGDSIGTRLLHGK